MMRKIVVVFLLVLLCGAGLAVQAEELSNAEYQYTVTDGQVTITRYLGSSQSVAIPSYIDGMPVTAIGKAAFRYLGSKGISHVTIPNTVTVIGDYAFCELTTLKSVTLPSGLISIGQSAFHSTQLTNVTVPASVTSLGRGAFFAIKSLAELHLPDGITTMGLSIANTATKIYCGKYSDTAKNLTDHMFADPADPYLFMQYQADGAGLAVVDYTGSGSVVYVPDGVTEIAKDAFCAAFYMERIELPDSLKTIKGAAFMM